MSRRQAGQSRGTARRPARLLPATIRTGAGILAKHGQTGSPGGRQAQDGTTQVRGSSIGEDVLTQMVRGARLPNVFGAI